MCKKIINDGTKNASKRLKVHVSGLNEIGVFPMGPTKQFDQSYTHCKLCS